jgi:putative transposase
VEANNDATLDELRYQLEQKTGVLIGRSTVERMLKKLNLTIKKKHYTPAKKKVSGYSSNE